jgi:hypothetical protein
MNTSNEPGWDLSPLYTDPDDPALARDLEQLQTT